MVTFDLLLGISRQSINCNLRLVKNEDMFILRVAVNQDMFILRVPVNQFVGLFIISINVWCYD